MFSLVLSRFHCNKNFLVYIKNEIYAFRFFLTFFSRANFSTFNFLFTLLQTQYFLSICLSLRFDFDDDGCPLCPHLNRAAPLLLPRSCVDSEPSSGRMVGQQLEATQFGEHRARFEQQLVSCWRYSHTVLACDSLVWPLQQYNIGMDGVGERSTQEQQQDPRKASMIVGFQNQVDN